MIEQTNNNLNYLHKSVITKASQRLHKKIYCNLKSNEYTGSILVHQAAVMQVPPHEFREYEISLFGSGKIKMPFLLETFGEGVLQLNGIDRFDKRPANYFRLVQNYQFHNHYSSKNIYTYSFSIYPEKQQPSGSCNLSKITNTNLYLNYFNIDHSQNDMILKVYGVNYNIFKIMSGMGGLSFSN